MKKSITIAMVMGIQILFSLGMQILIIRKMGAGVNTDAFIAAQAVPAFIIAIVITPLQSLWQPHMSIASLYPSKIIELQKIAHTQVLIIFLIFGLTLALSAFYGYQFYSQVYQITKLSSQ